MKIEQCKKCRMYPTFVGCIDGTYAYSCACGVIHMASFEAAYRDWNEGHKPEEELPVNEDCLCQPIWVSNNNILWVEKIFMGFCKYHFDEETYFRGYELKKNSFYFYSSFRYAKRIPGIVYKKPEWFAKE